jgi:hypothetical protein
MARTTANQRPGGELTPQETLNKLMELGIDGPRGLNIMAIARKHGIKAEALDKGIVEVWPAGPMTYTLKVSRRA